MGRNIKTVDKMKFQIDPELDAKVSLLYTLGNSTYQIADQLEIDRNTVQAALRRTNTPTRSISDAMKLRRAFA